MNTYTVGVIGCGRIASLLEQETHRGNPNTHAGCYDYCQHTTIVAAADANTERLHAFGRRWNASQLYASWEEMLEKEKLDIVSVCTYPIPHRNIVVAAAEAGVKAIFCEKLMATTLREADEMIAACDTHDVKLSINHGRRWDWEFRKAKEILDQGRIGELQAMTLNFSAGLANNGTHYLDMLHYFAGDVAWSFGHLHEKNSLDPYGSGYFCFQSGVCCTVNGVTGDKAAHIYELIGSKGRMTLGNPRPPRFRLFVDSGTGKLEEEPFPELPEDQKMNTFGTGRCVIPLSVQEIVESLNQDKDTVSTGREGRAALEMVLSFHESERLGNVRVDFPLKNHDLQVLVRRADFISSVVPE